MVHVELTDVDWLEVAVFTVIFFVDRVWIDEFVVGLKVDGLALVLTAKVGSFAVSKFDSSRSTDGAYTCAGVFINLRKSVLHHDLGDTVRLLGYRRSSILHPVHTRLARNPQRTLPR